MSYGYDDGGYGGSAGGDDSDRGKSQRVRDSLENYIDVPQRLAEFREQYPEGRLRPADPLNPIKVVHIEGINGKGEVERQTFLEYVCLCYRAPDDTLPGIGIAWEIFPGRTPYTRNSEAMNAETSAWGRAIVAALIADARAGIASKQEVRNRRAERDQENRPDPNPPAELEFLDEALSIMGAASNKQEMVKAWRWAGSHWLHDAQIPGENPGYLYRHLWSYRMNFLTEEAEKRKQEAARQAGLGEETGDVQVAPEDTWEVVRFPNGEVDQVATLRNEVEWKKARGIQVGPGEESQDAADGDEAMAQAAEQAVQEGLGAEKVPDAQNGAEGSEEQK